MPERPLRGGIAAALILVSASMAGAPALGQGLPASQAGESEAPGDRAIIEGAKAAIEERQYDAARAMLEPLLARRPDDPEVLFLLATIAARQRQFGRAIPLYRRIL